ncbi:MAG: hypothetical protein QGI46_11735 [Planctomycetota bacterium]|nr:hypothetical protein [Planctomycetota bacterium]
MTPPTRSIALALIACAALASAASAQAPKAGKFFEDSVDLGFKVKMPDKWDFTPPRPGEKNLIGKYTPPYTKYINLSGTEILWLEAYLIKFDRRGEEEQSAREEALGTESLMEWIESSTHFGGSGYRPTREKETKVSRVPATEYLITGTGQGGTEFQVYAMVYRLQPEVDVAVVFDGPGGRTKWRKYEGSFKRMAKSFKPIEVEQLDYSGPRSDDSAYRSRKRAQLEKEVALSQGGKNPWALYETPNYFIISNVDDRQFLRELQDRIEAIRAVYEEMYPWEQADRLRLERREREKEEKADGEDAEPAEERDAEEEAGDDEPEVGRTAAAEATPRERSRCSVVRVCAKQSEYSEYGGPGGSAGYWAWVHEELVLYDDKAGGGRGDTWAVLNHEAFHQYIFYLYGKLSPHSWYNEGHGDFFSGHEYKHKRFVLKPFDWRVRTIQQAIRDGKHVPLKDLVRFTQREYYGNNKYGVGGGQNYAQGWSFVYFLRTGKKSSSKWNKAWDDVLDVYFTTLASTADLDQAVERAFAGVDWNELEEAWKQHTL